MLGEKFGVHKFLSSERTSGMDGGTQGAGEMFDFKILIFEIYEKEKTSNTNVRKEFSAKKKNQFKSRKLLETIKY